ncbi:MAG: tetratricopeptide repeat protein [Thermoanaerobaculia bacterium]
MADESTDLYAEFTVRDLLKLGLAALKAKRVPEASAMLFEVCERFTRNGERVPPTALSLYALTLAHQNRMKDAIDTCRLALRRDPDNATSRLHMARIYLLADSRRRAVEEMQKGLAITPRHPELLALQKELGDRRKPVIGFLARQNPLNVKLGKARSQARKNPAKSA